jgi:response regulator RpfG family c-di-GMP phosphodiesterase
MAVLVYHSSLIARRIFATALKTMRLPAIRIRATEQELLQALEDHGADLIIVEKELLHTQEYQLLHQLHTIPSGPPPAVMVAGYQFTREETIEAIGHNVDELLLLPLNRDVLTKKVRTLIFH